MNKKHCLSGMLICLLALTGCQNASSPVQSKPDSIQEEGEKQEGQMKEGEEGKDENEQETAQTSPEKETTPKQTDSSETAGKTLQEDKPMLIKVEGHVYQSAGRNNDEAVRCGNSDGTIDSIVDVSSIPKEDNQSNFGTGYEWMYGQQPDTIEVLIDGHWEVFEPYTS